MLAVIDIFGLEIHSIGKTKNARISPGIFILVLQTLFNYFYFFDATFETIS